MTGLKKSICDEAYDLIFLLGSINATRIERRAKKKIHYYIIRR